MEKELITIVNDSGLEKTKADYILEKFNDYFQIASEWEKKAKAIIVTNDNQKVDMEIARVGRLFLRDKRIAVEKVRKDLKEQSLREGKAIDGIANVLKSLIIPIEEYLEHQENFTRNRLMAEEQERARLEMLRLDAEEQERIKKEKEEQERIKKENEKLKQEMIEKEKLFEKERIKHAEILKQQKEKAEKERIEKEKLLKKIADEKQIIIDEENKLKTASDIEKIKIYYDGLLNVTLPEIKEAKLKNILFSFQKQLQENISKLKFDIKNI